MLLSHVSVGLAGKKFAPKVSLGTLILAGTWSDIVMSILAIAGIEKVRIVPGITLVNPFDMYYYPFSHSLMWTVIWALLFAGIYYFFKKDIRSSIVLGACVLSHCVFDIISHRPDVEIIPGIGSPVGLGLWNSFAGTVAVEVGLFIVCVAIYLYATKSKRMIGYVPLALLIFFNAFMFTGWLLGPAPKATDGIFVMSLVMQLIGIALAYAADRFREAR
ncbi:MAG TPA: hypothetical protein PKK43_10220 [Spirochaetota bacterium]|nr:hypothetical protein [Spirochaetota bacterium]